jgi:hypothetical protein
MKKILLLGLAVAVSFTSFGQKAQLKSGFKAEKKSFANKIAIEPVQPLKMNTATPKPAPVKNDGDNRAIVTIIPIGSSANAYGYGYAGGQKTMVWADDNLKAVINLHRMGPGTTPPSLSGYLSVDLGTNYGVTAADWQNNRQIYNAVIPGGDYYVDAARYPSGAIYNPEGNTALANAYAVYFAPNLSNAGTWGGYSYGTANLVNQADSVKHLKYFDPPPYNYIPDGFSISQQGVALAVDKDYDETNLYHGNFIVNRGVWNATSHDFDYTEALIAFPTTDNGIPADERVAFSPDGQTAWIVTISNDGSISPVIAESYYPILFKSTDGGVTWGSPIAIQLDGPDGIPGIVQHLLSDYRIAQIFDPIPDRTEIPYTTAFDCDIAVDKWGNPHIGVIVGISADGYAISVPNTAPPNAYDSSFAAFDIYSTDDGVTWNAQVMGYPTTFRGTFGTLTEDNRVNIATTRAGDKMFVTWNDTQIGGVTDNNQCDVFSRGFNLITNKITNSGGNCAPDNVTFLSDITQQACFECTSHYVFTQTGKCTIPICTETLTVPGDDTQPVDFFYISDFSYSDAAYTCDVFSENNSFPVGINDNGKGVSMDMTIFPNPFKGVANVSVTVPNSGNLSMTITNIVGQNMMSVEKGNVNAGKQTFTIDGSKLAAGVYFCTVKLDDQSFTKKMIVK